ncbi:MAG TPA: hypothetical protein DCZ10_11285 [Pelotomaculum sp.]|nr:hypothetical protein [Pelotomaculum sp.]
MTSRETQIIYTIQTYTAAKGYPPSVRELGFLVGLSSSSTVHHYMHFEPNRPRTLRVILHV